MAEYIEREAVLKDIENDYQNVEKIKTHFARIVVDGSAEKPYYSILWFDEANKEYNIGYSSYCLDYVFKWLEEEFDIVPVDEATAADVEPVRHGQWVWDEKWDIDVPNHNSTLEYCGWFCSSCGIELGEYMTTSTREKHYLDDDINTPSLNYCPNCGAKMDLKGE